MAGETIDELLAQCGRERIVVRRQRLGDDLLGAWSLTQRTIWIDSRLTDRHAAPVLAHEMVHAHRADPGCQGRAVESLINERVAAHYVDPVAYALAERIRGPYAACIAEELDLPQWVVEAWQRRLQRAA